MSLFLLLSVCLYLSLVVISLTDNSIKHLSIAKQEQLDDESDNSNELEGYLMKLIRQLKLLENVCKYIVLYCITNITMLICLHGLLKNVHSYYHYSQHRVNSTTSTFITYLLVKCAFC